MRLNDVVSRATDVMFKNCSGARGKERRTSPDLQDGFEGHFVGVVGEISDDVPQCGGEERPFGGFSRGF